MQQVAARYLRVIHESNHFIAVSKPPFATCQDEPGNESSLSSLLRKHEPALFRERETPFHAPKGLHRLDALVTGCVLYGTSVYGTRLLAKHFMQRKIEKGYLALLQPTESYGISSVLETLDSGTVETLDRKTKWTVLARLRPDNGRLYLCWLSPYEGRKHQLRIHAADGLNAPILFDTRYNSSQMSPGVYNQTREDGIALHCASLKFPLGLDAQSISCTPPDFGIWKRVAEDFSIDWEDVIKQGQEFRLK